MPENASVKTFSFFSYDAKKSYPCPEGMRMITCLYRAAEGKTAAGENSAIFVPNWINSSVVKENLDLLSESFVVFLQKQEEERVRTSHRNKSVGFGDAYFTLANLLEYMESTGTSGKLSGESIKAWYVANLKDAVVELYKEKGQSEEKAKAIADFLGDKLIGLAGPKTVWDAITIGKILPILEAVKDDSMGARLIDRINAMKKREEDVLDLM